MTYVNAPYETFERRVVGLVAIGASIILLFLAIQGPLFRDKLNYKTSDSAIYQTIGQDIINLLILAPLLFIGGYLTFINHPWAKYWLILTPLYLIYMALSYGIGMEWADDRYEGNSQNYFFAYVYLVITGLIVLMYSISKFDSSDTPQFSEQKVRIYVTLVAIFLIIFANLWIDEVREVLSQGDTPTGSYSSAPTIFWVIRYFDLGITIPLGFISIYLMITRLETSYPYLLLFFGFFVTMILAVNAMGGVMWYNHDPELQTGDLYVFWSMALLSLIGYLFLIFDKIKGVLS